MHIPLYYLNGTAAVTKIGINVLHKMSVLVCAATWLLTVTT